ncbi:MAG: hypothetical protein ACLQU1_24915 [Bryobacteraceae bacterium]
MKSFHAASELDPSLHRQAGRTSQLADTMLTAQCEALIESLNS